MKRFKDPVVPKDQLFLLPPSVEDFVPQNAPVRILSEAIDCLDCEALYARYPGGGATAYDPRMMLKVLVFGYSEGLRSSRRLDAALGYDLRFMFLAEMSRPDFHTIARFRKDNEASIKTLFKDTVHLCQAMGLVLLEHVAVDGTKIEANVSGKQTFCTERLDKAIEHIMQEAERTDAEEDRKESDGDGHGDELLKELPQGLPKELGDRERRKKQLKAAKDVLLETGHNTVAVTDTESRLMKTKSGNRPAYNAQAAVDGAHHIIVAASITQDTVDGRQLAPMIELTQANTGATPVHITADTGYYSPEALRYVDEQRLDAYIAEPAEQDNREGYVYDPDKDQFRGTTEATQSHLLTFYRFRMLRGKEYRIYRDARNKKELYFRDNPAQQTARQHRMHEKLTSSEGKSIYKQRQHTVEPVFGHIKGSYNLRRLLLRGMAGATIEFLLACCAHNIGKLRAVWLQESNIGFQT